MKFLLKLFKPLLGRCPPWL